MAATTQVRLLVWTLFSHGRVRATGWQQAREPRRANPLAQGLCATAVSSARPARSALPLANRWARAGKVHSPRRENGPKPRIMPLDQAAVIFVRKREVHAQHSGAQACGEGSRTCIACRSRRGRPERRCLGVRPAAIACVAGVFAFFAQRRTAAWRPLTVAGAHCLGTLASSGACH